MINRDYQYMRRAETLADLEIEKGALYIYGHDMEERSHACADFFREKRKDVKVLELEYVDNDCVVIVGHETPPISLDSQKAILEMINSYSTEIIYIDVTGMNVRMAAAIISKSYTHAFETHVVYVEPHKYITEQYHKEGEDHEWAGIIDGIVPLPGFKNFSDSSEDFIFCVFLGFEGGRFTHMLKEIQPIEDLIRPIIGVPGFRVEYPYNAYWSNRKGLSNSVASANVHYASAYSIVDAYLLLNKIMTDNIGKKIKVAPIGTKPHAIAAILFAMKNFRDVEIVYDNPQKKESRSEGVGLILDCNLSRLLNDNPT